MTIERINYSSGSPLEEKHGYSRIVRIGPFIFAGGTTSVQADGSVYGEGDSAAQASYIYEKLVCLIEKAGGCAEDVISVKRYQTPAFDSKAARSAYSDIFRNIRPLNTAVTIKSLNRPAQLCEIEMTAVIGSSKGAEWNGMKLDRVNYSSGSPLEDVMGYSRMVKTGPFIFIGGTTSVLPDGSVAGEGNADAQDDFILDKQIKLLEEAGASSSDIIMMKKYVTPGCHLCRGAGSAVWAENFGAITPVCTEVPVTRLNRPAQLEEIELAAIPGSGGTELRSEWGMFDFRRTPSPAGIVKAGPVVYCGGTQALSASGEAMYADDALKQESCTMEKTFRKAEQFGVTADDVVKVMSYRSPAYESRRTGSENSFYASSLKPVKPLYTAVGTERFAGSPDILSQTELFAVIQKQ